MTSVAQDLLGQLAAQELDAATCQVCGAERSAAEHERPRVADYMIAEYVVFDVHTQPLQLSPKTARELRRDQVGHQRDCGNPVAEAGRKRRRVPRGAARLRV